MICDIYYGKIKADRINTWESNSDPFDILEDRVALVNMNCWNFLQVANKVLKDKVQIDWGSFAYRASVTDMLALGTSLNCAIPNLEDYDIETEFGVVFVES